MSACETAELIALARDGDETARGELVARYRGHLRRLAQKLLDSDVKTRVDPSDVVQQSCLAFHRDFHSFRGTQEAELLAWLQQILRRAVANTIRCHVSVAKRSVRKERPLPEIAVDDGVLEMPVAADQSSPSAQARRREAIELLEGALGELPEDQSEAVRLRHLRGWSLERLATHFGRSEMAVAGLLKRGLQTLRVRLAEK